MHGNKRLVRIFFFSGIVVFSSFAAFMMISLSDQKDFNLKNTSSVKNITMPKPPGRTIVILIDSLRKDMMFNEEIMPFMHSRLERGAYGIAEVLSNPLTISCDKSIFSGQIDINAWSLSEDFKGVRYANDNLFRRLSQEKRNTAILSSGSIYQTFGDYGITVDFIPRKLKFNEYRVNAQYLFEKSHKLLSGDGWDFAVIQFLSVDFAGHLHTPKSMEYINMVKDIDKYLEQLVSLAKPEDTVLITAEHGMDDNGCHIDANEITIETPFIIFGPRIRKVAEARIFQIDWAPTLSVLSGINPFYDGLSLPAFEIMDLKDGVEWLNPVYSEHLGFSRALPYKSLDKSRRSLIGVERSPFLGTIAFFAFGISAALLCLAALSGHFLKLNKFMRLRVLVIITAIIFLPAAATMSGFWDLVANNLPFRTDMIIGHPVLSCGLLCVLTVIPFLSWRIFRRKLGGFAEVLAFIAFITMTAAMFIVDNPYYPLCWAVLAISLSGWLETFRTGWIILFLSICAGFAIRRLTYIVLVYPAIIPERSTIICILAGVFFGIFLIRSRLSSTTNSARPSLIALSLLPCVIVKFLPLDAPLSAFILLLCAVPMICVFRHDRGGLALALAFWMTSYYLVTSSSIESLSLLVAFPIFLAAWKAGADSTVSKGVFVCLVIWSLYIIPGNSFGYKVIEILDPYIMGSVEIHNILPSICLIASRYILPVIIIFAMLRLKDENSSLTPVLAVAALPVVWAIGFRLSLIAFTGSAEYPWFQMQRITVLGIYLCLLICGFLLVSMLFRLRKWKFQIG